MRALLVFIMLAGCAAQKTGPSYVSTALPDIPQHCDLQQKPSPTEPKLKEQDTTDIDAAKDRLALKQAYRTVKAYRGACYEELRSVLGVKAKPTS